VKRKIVTNVESSKDEDKDSWKELAEWDVLVLMETSVGEKNWAGLKRWFPKDYIYMGSTRHFAIIEKHGSDKIYVFLNLRILESESDSKIKNQGFFKKKQFQPQYNYESHVQGQIQSNPVIAQEEH
ncbi:hypothetical protein PV328_011757, partial [Microctonus aethiopoides]